MLTTLPKNSKFAIVGDSHGLKDELERLIYEIRLRHGNIPIFSTGDLIDRGAKSFETVELCIAENIHSVRGNHDQCMAECLEGQIDDFWFSQNMGGGETVKSYARNMNHVSFQDYHNFKRLVPFAHEQYFKSMPLWRLVRIEGQEEEYVITHAGVGSGFARRFTGGRTTEQILQAIVEAPNGQETLLWGRPSLTEDNLFHFENGYQVFGHTPVEEPIVSKTFAAVDTGAFYSQMGHLSAIILPTKETISVQTELKNFYV